MTKSPLRTEGQRVTGENVETHAVEAPAKAVITTDQRSYPDTMRIRVVPPETEN